MSADEVSPEPGPSAAESIHSYRLVLEAEPHAAHHSAAPFREFVAATDKALALPTEAGRTALRKATAALIAKAPGDTFLQFDWGRAPLVETQRMLRLDSDALDEAKLLGKLQTVAFMCASEVVDRPLVDEAQREIEEHRTSGAVVRVVDAEGQPVKDVAVTVRPLRSEVLFGANLYRLGLNETAALDTAYRDRYTSLFNYATTGLYWKDYEQQRGRPHYRATERVVDWCKEHDIELKGHPILWDHPTGKPRWVDGDVPAELQKKRVEDLLATFGASIRRWEVVNEPASKKTPIDAAYRWARAADPNAYLIVNDYGIFLDGMPAFFELLEAAIERDVPFDGIGIQGHSPLSGRYSLAHVRDQLRRYGSLGKELHLTELTPCSGGQPIEASPLGGRWNEVLQAEYAWKLYQVLYANPSVVAISWWDVSDSGAWQEGGGLLRADMSPKPSYEALHSLLRERWWTRVAERTDDAGLVRFRGHHGRYRVEVDGASTDLRLRKGGLNLATVRLPASGQ